MKMRISWAAGALLVLCGCGSQPVTVDEMPALQPDEGIAAVVMNAPDPIWQISFAPRFSGGKSFEVPDTRGGPSLYLVPVKAGRYCLDRFRYEHTRVQSREDLGCFTVIAGHLTYGGEIVPEIQDRNSASNIVYTDQRYEMQRFQEMLRAQFPRTAAAYPLAAPAAPPAGTQPPSNEDEVALWERDNADHTATLFAQNNAAWPVRLVHFELYNCVNVKQPCDRQTLNLQLAPFETRELVTLSAADPTEGYQYRYSWDFSDHP